MGYRSDVYYAIAFPNDEEMASFIAQAKVLSKQPLGQDAQESELDATHWGDMVSALDECTIKWGEGKGWSVILFYSESVKWYPTYNDVHSHESLIALARVLYEGKGGDMVYAYTGEGEAPVSVSRIAYEFVRVGEDDDDIERRDAGVSPCVNRVWVERRIRTAKEFEKLVMKRDDN